MATIFIVDDDKDMCRRLERELREAGHHVSSYPDLGHALESLGRQEPDIIVADLRTGRSDGTALLRKVKSVAPAADVVVMAAHDSARAALEMVKHGAYDYVMEPFETDEVSLIVDRIEQRNRLAAENRALRSYLSPPPSDDIVGGSDAIKRIKELVAELSQSAAPVLIRGEGGTGKKLVARVIHRRSPRASGPFITMRCAATPETILDRELFGYERGAFTGATRRTAGHFQLASGGTLFLDEIGELPPSLQLKLVRVLEDGRIRPLGGETEIAVDVRVVSATTRPLEEEIRCGRFREDLFYRINVFPIMLPPLREHREDARPIAEKILEAAGRPLTDLTEPAVRKLIGYNWPGNMRELENVLERVLMVCPSGDIGPEHILLPPTGPAATDSSPSDLSIEDMEQQLITRALRAAGGNKSEAARLLGITRRALYGRLDRYGIND